MRQRDRRLRPIRRTHLICPSELTSPFPRKLVRANLVFALAATLHTHN
jgi:hypothetical protein